MDTKPVIKTNIKFYKGLDNVADKLYGFVTKIDGSWRGCRQDAPKKKIVFIDEKLAKDIIPNQLYRCTLTPMANDGGFIVISTAIMKFPAMVRTNTYKGRYSVKVTFGNKCLIYDPASSEKRKRNIQAIAENLRKRSDLENAWQVAEDFINAAVCVKRLYEQSL